MLNTRYTKWTFGRESTFLLLAALWWLPILILVLISMKSYDEVFQNPMAFPTSLNFSNYMTAWEGDTSVTLPQAVGNSVIITGISIVLIILLAAPAAYALVRRGGTLGAIVSYAFLVAYIIPNQVALIPTYVVLQNLKLIGTHVGSIVVYVAMLLPLAVFLYSTFIRALPRDYEEAAEVDGASVLRMFWQVVFPLLRPITGTVAVLTGLLIWNEFFFALISLGGSPAQTLPVLVRTFAEQQILHYENTFAMIVMALLPALFFFSIAQRQLIRGFTGGVKG